MPLHDAGRQRYAAQGEATGLVATGGAQEAAVKSLGNRGGAITDPSLA
jgi:hypothetical protein